MNKNNIMVVSSCRYRRYRTSRIYI